MTMIPQPNSTPSTQGVALVTPTVSTNTNFDTQTRKSRINQPWIANISQTHAQSVTTTGPAAAKTLIGLDTIGTNTYNPSSTPTYNLGYTSQTIGGHAYPNTGIILPSAGIYSMEAQTTLAWTTVNSVYVQYNLVLCIGSNFFSTGPTVFENSDGTVLYACLQVTWQDLFAIQDVIYLYLQFQDPIGGNVVNLSNVTLSIRYQGQS